jgi:hypothetical protein
VLELDPDSPERTLRWLAGLLAKSDGSPQGKQFAGSQAWARYNAEAEAVRGTAVRWPLTVARVEANGEIHTQPVKLSGDLSAFRIDVRPARPRAAAGPESLTFPPPAAIGEPAALRRGDRVVVRGVLHTIRMKAEELPGGRGGYVFEVFLEDATVVRADRANKP